MTTETLEVPTLLCEAGDCTQSVERFRQTPGSVRGIATIDLDLQAWRSDVAVVRILEMDFQDEVNARDGKLRTLPGIPGRSRNRPSLN
jgi:hypothetical protein